jgi:FkbH-like protein
LVGALNGSDNHAALYFDERMRYIDKHAPSAEMLRSLREDMAVEFAAIADAFKHELPPELIQQELQEFHELISSPPASMERVLFIGDCIFVETRAFLLYRSVMSGRPVDVRHVFFSARPPRAKVNTAIVNEVQHYQPDLIGLSLFTFEGIPPYVYAWNKAAVPITGIRAVSAAEGLVDLARETITDIRKVSDCTVALHVPCGVRLDRVRRHLPALPAHSRGQRRLLTKLAEGLQELAASVENVLIIDEVALARGVGGIRTAARYAFDENDVPPGYAHATVLGPAFASHYHELLTDYATLGKAKALFVDFDNTLWQGVMAEGEVVQDTAIQQLLLQLKDAGILLVALSKNDESAIRWNEMALSPDDFVMKKINWLPKPDNVSAAISELDLAPDAFILLDDNPVERALVTEMVPGVNALDPARPESLRTLRRWLAFPSTQQTAEARRRTIMYREAAERRSAMSQPHDYQTVMRTLGLRYQVTQAQATDLPRVVELIQRTNQFNTTTRRRSVAEIKLLISSDTSRVYAASLRDRFGSLGIVAVVIFDEANRLFDSVIMSCRAMGFGLEFALLRAVMDMAGPGSFRGVFVATDRNGPAAGLFEQAGFHRETENTWLLPSASPRPEVSGWLTRE